MFVMYDAETGMVNASAEVSNVEGYADTLNKVGRPFVLVPGGLQKPLHHYRVVDGIIYQVPEMMIEAPAEVAAGAEFSVTGVPAGARILLDGVEAGVMDNSGVLELSFDIPGNYHLMFLQQDYVPKEISIEARS